MIPDNMFLRFNIPFIININYISSTHTNSKTLYNSTTSIAFTAFTASIASALLYGLNLPSNSTTPACRQAGL